MDTISQQKTTTEEERIIVEINGEDIYKILGVTMPDMDKTKCLLVITSNHDKIEIDNIFSVNDITKRLDFKLVERTIEVDHK